MQSLMFLDCFVQKLSKKLKTFGGSARPPLVKEGLKKYGGSVQLSKLSAGSVPTEPKVPFEDIWLGTIQVS